MSVWLNSLAKMRPIWQKFKKRFPKLALLIRNLYFRTLKLIRKIGPSVCSLNYLGYTLFYNRESSLARRVRTENNLWLDFFHLLKEELRDLEQPVLIDIGAHLGLISLAAKKYNPTTRIFAFEPGPQQREMFRRTITYNHLGGIELFSLAIADQVAQWSFWVHEEGEESKDGLVNTKPGVGAKKITVPVTTLDTWAQPKNFSRLDILKIDTEGSELKVLCGAQELLRRFHPVIFIEISANVNQFYPYGPHDILRFLEKLGYKVTDFVGRPATAETIDELARTTGNFIAK